MKNHPLSVACAYVMLGALIVFGIAGLALRFADSLPAAWAGAIGQAKTAMIVSLAAAFVAAAIASMRSTWHAMRAHEAGRGYRHIMWLALLYSAVCIVIDVAIGKIGASMIGLDIPVWALTGMLVFFAIAPRIVAAILSGLDGLARAEGKADDQVEHIRTLDRIEASGRASSQRIQAGVSSLNRERVARKLGGGAALGAAAALIGASGAPTAAQVEYPAYDAAMSVADAEREFADIAANIPANIPVAEEREFEREFESASPWPRGPRQSHVKRFWAGVEIVRAAPAINAQTLARRLDIDQKTGRKWLRWARTIIDNPDMAELIEIPEYPAHRTTIGRWRQAARTGVALAAHVQNAELLDSAA